MSFVTLGRKWKKAAVLLLASLRSLLHSGLVSDSRCAKATAHSSAGTGSPSWITLLRARTALCLFALLSLGWSALAAVNWAGVVSGTVMTGIRVPAKGAGCELALDGLIDREVEKREQKLPRGLV